MRNFIEAGKKIVGIYKNYPLKAVAGSNNVAPENPIFFLKPISSYIREGASIRIPPGCNRVFYEVELGVVIGSKAKKIRQNEVSDYVSGYTLALDMTARDLLQTGSPWSIGKGFDTACPVSRFITKSELVNPTHSRLWLKVDNVMKQDGNTSDMIFDIPKLVSYISQYITLEPGDVILTGTPAGIGPVSAGQNITCGLEDIIQMSFEVQ